MKLFMIKETFRFTFMLKNGIIIKIKTRST